MKKIGILSFINAYNYGGILQIYALQNVLASKSKVEVINYNSEFIKKCYVIPSFSQFLNLRFLYKLFFRNTLALYYKEGFERFKKERLILSEKEYLNSNFHELDSDYDRIIVGSDQVWSLRCNGNDLNYFLPFKSKKLKKYSYAASLGTATAEEKLEKAIKNYLNDFRKISVREESSKSMIEKILKNDVSIDCDPTLLLTKEEWASFCRERLIKYDYILVYMIYEDKKILKIANKIAKKINKKVVYINNRLFKAFGIKNLSRVSPEDWVNLFYNASYIITNSFHGIAFSINFNKQFQCDLLPFNNDANIRITDILKAYGLSDRINSNAFNYEIDYESINPLIIQRRNKSMDYLSEIIED